MKIKLEERFDNFYNKLEDKALNEWIGKGPAGSFTSGKVNTASYARPVSSGNGMGNDDYTRGQNNFIDSFKQRAKNDIIILKNTKDTDGFNKKVRHHEVLLTRYKKDFKNATDKNKKQLIKNKIDGVKAYLEIVKSYNK